MSAGDSRRAADDRAALVALLQSPPDGMPRAHIADEVLEHGSALAVWEHHTPLTLVPPPESDDPLVRGAGELAAWTAAGIACTTVLDPGYPIRLRGVHQAPPLLFTRGRLDPDDLGVSVVGSRDASPAGRDFAAEVSRGLVHRNLSVIAGLARGIDTASHRAALEAGGRTVAVIGTGINRVYPAENRDLQQQIAQSGLLLSQFWPDAPAAKHTFLMRNATMSGYGLATVVVEAGEKSGTRVQARMAVEHGRPVILSEAVVQRNEWARNLVGQSGVSVADGPETVLAAIDRLVSELAEIESTLLDLAIIP